MGHAMTNGRCRIHGGLTPSGAASPHFRTGRRSKYLPERLLTKYQETQDDPDLIELRDEVNLVDLRVNELLEGLGKGAATVLWTELAERFAVYMRLKNSYTEADRMKADDALMAIDDLVCRGVSDSRSWAEIFALVEQRRKLSESEVKRLNTMGQLITTEKVMALIHAVGASVRKHVTDPKVLQNVQRELVAIATNGDREQTDGR